MSGYLVLRWVSLLLDVSVKSALLMVGTGAILLLLRRASGMMLTVGFWIVGMQ